MPGTEEWRKQSKLPNHAILCQPFQAGSPLELSHTLVHHLCNAIRTQFPTIELRVFPLILSYRCEVTAEELQGHTSSAPCASLLQVAFLIFSLFITPLNNFSREHRCLHCPLMMCPNGEINGIKYSWNGM